jgi:hypothetical protein
MAPASLPTSPAALQVVGVGDLVAAHRTGKSGLLYDPAMPRECFYVAVSRGSESNTVHIEADSIGQAFDDLAGVKARRARFVIDSERILNPAQAADVRRLETARMSRRRDVERGQELEQDVDWSREVG